jgi:OOP family OmpA-OmpF porin
MKLVRFIEFALFCAVIILTAQNANAGIREGAFSLSPMVGYYGFEGDQNTDDGIVAGLALGYNVSKRWATELEFRYIDTEIAPPNASNEDLSASSLGLNALYHFRPDKDFVPYLSAGFGIMYFDAEDFDVDSDYIMNWGVGAKYFFTDNTALRADLRHIIDFHSDREWDRVSGDDIDHNYMASVGLFFQFGGPSPPPPPPEDSDGDGIPDQRDKCPDTPLGVMVDAVGCPPVEKAPQPPADKVDGDDDEDGVLNSRDKCPGTEKGVMVDEDGCPLKFTLQVEFDFDKAQVRPEYRDELRKAAAFINKYSNAQFLLAGHTDSVGSDDYNLTLSKRRAVAVKEYLVSEFGISAELLTPRGYGEKRPVATNETEEGRQINRRVEVICCVVIPPE